MSKQIVLLAIDIETNGPDVLRHEIISIGYCIGDTDGKIFTKGRINFRFSTEFEPSCGKFWSRIYLKI